ncbi:MAG: DUF5362 domain-containing protein [Kiritimatiellae bacterium]|nr:DUF5362 domain-containing protein [Kiritimatiellia bacterium]
MNRHSRAEPTVQLRSHRPPSRSPRLSPPRESRAPAFGGWLTFVGLFNILSGSMMILTCFGTPAGILMILAGIAAMGAKTALDQTGDIPAEFAPVMARLRKFFIYTGVIVILNLVAFVLFALTMSSSLAIALPQILEQLQ